MRKLSVHAITPQQALLPNGPPNPDALRVPIPKLDLVLYTRALRSSESLATKCVRMGISHCSAKVGVQQYRS